MKTCMLSIVLLLGCTPDTCGFDPDYTCGPKFNDPGVTKSTSAIDDGGAEAPDGGTDS